MRRFFEYIKNLTKSESNESSKRFMALYITLSLITFVVVTYTDKHNVELILGELITFVLALATVAGWEKRNKAKYKDNETGDT